MAQIALRFAVQHRSRTACTWKLWTETSARQTEVYLVARELHGELKVSLHEKGGWHVAHSKKYFEEEVLGVIPWVTSRYTDRWARPGRIARGITFAIQIVTPWWAVTSPMKSEDRGNVLAIPNASVGKATAISLFLVERRVAAPPWPIIGSLPLRSGETALVTHWELEEPNLDEFPKGGRGAFYRDKTIEDVKRAGPERLRMLGFGTHPTGARVIFDFAAAP